MANISIFQQRADQLSDWQSTNKPVYPGEIVIATEDGTGVPTNIAIGKKNPATPTATTPFNELVLWYLLNQADREKLDELVVATGENVVALINAYLETDLATAINDAGLDYNGLATILDTGPNGTQWRDPGAVSIYGNPMDLDGDLTIPDNALTISTIADLQDALDLKSDVGHGHPTSQITGLVDALAAKVDNSTLGVTTATLGEDGKLTPEQVPAALAAPVDSVFGRTGVVVKQAGDYIASDITATPGGTLVGSNVAAQLAELETEKQALADRGQADGYCDLNALGYIPSTRLSPADSAHDFTTYAPWVTATSVITDAPAAEQSMSVQARSIQFNLTYATSVVASVFVGVVAFPTNGGVRFKYATDVDGYTTWTTLCEVIADNALGTIVQRYGNETTVPAGAKTSTTRVRSYTFGGDGAADPSIGQVGMFVNHSVPIHTGNPTGAAIVAEIDAELSGTTWRDPAGALVDGSVTLAKIQNFATQTAPLRKSAGSGVLEVGTQADWRTFMDVTNTVFGRKGTVVVQAGDYNADMISEMPDRAFIHPTVLAAVTRGVTKTEFTTSSTVGLTQAAAIFTGGTTTFLTATLSNAATNEFVFIFNARTVNVNVVPQSGVTMANSTGGALTTYALTPGSAICARRIGSVFRILA